jgi:hypothetical protein
VTTSDTTITACHITVLRDPAEGTDRVTTSDTTERRITVSARSAVSVGTLVLPLVLACMPAASTAQKSIPLVADRPLAETSLHQPHLFASDTSLVSGEASIRVWNDAARTELATLRDLRDGWDGRRAPAPNEFSFLTAERLIVAAERAGVELGRVAADADGGLVLYAFADSVARIRRVGFVIANDDEESLVVFKSDRGASDPDVEMVALKDVDIHRALVDAHRFLS